jgi:2'-phosphotransferase
MKRNHIHFATGLPATCSVSSEDGTQQSCREKKNVTPVSGMRASSQIYIYVNGRKCATEGIRFYRSDNGVILTAGTNDEGILPVKYFKKVVLASTGKILYDDD